jgi:hypothetical protein
VACTRSTIGDSRRARSRPDNFNIEVQGVGGGIGLSHRRARLMERIHVLVARTTHLLDADPLTGLGSWLAANY